MAGFSMIEFFKLGGVFMWPLLLFSVIGLAYIIERGYVLFRIDLRPPLSLPQVFNRVRSRDVEGAKNLLLQNEKNYISTVLKDGLDMINQDVPRIEKTLEASINIKVRRLEKGLNALIVLSNLAPLVGFLGTVSGMINAFKSIAAADEVSTQLVAKGIYEALITTVAGLVIAIVVISAYNVFIHMIDGFVSDSERLSNELIETLIENKIK
ncbi:MAG: MotA/TolQ/ExbB proton channel family protein [bacterium]|nr:MotA/TolQ/ExbB proton channel family protein [bacterium]